MKNVLIVNQSAELYGADRAILELIENYPAGYNPIVVLHEEGPLKVLLEKKGIQVIKTSVIKVKRGILKPSFFMGLPFEVIRSFSTIRKALKGKRIDIIHSNATSVFIGAFYSFFFRKKHLWHVHEIIEKPRRIALIYPRIVHFFSTRVVFNSNATANHFIAIYPKIETKSIVIHNGQQRLVPFITEWEKKQIRNEIFKAPEGSTVITLIGRISQIKGQLLLFESFKNCLKKHPDIHLVFIGSTVKGKDSYGFELKQNIVNSNLANKVTFVDFQENIWPFYDSSDIIVVPSTEPESFGLVATEAMLSKKPVVAANHGGLKEIVQDNFTGLLFEPNNTADLEQKLSLLIDSPKTGLEMGEKGLERVRQFFNTAKLVDSFRKEYDGLCS